MSVVVQKFGGTSVADAARIQAVASRVAATRAGGADVVVVVSAMGDTTDRLIALAAEITTAPPARELDMLLTAGERISMSLLAMALHERGVGAVSYTGTQAGIHTDAAHGAARITGIRSARVRESLAAGHVVIVAGFQGVTADSREITTLGRGGSDASAVALAAVLEAEACEIYTDVAGVFTADPRLYPRARKLAEISFEEMLELTAQGARVLMARSVEFGRRFHIPIHVRSSFTAEEGTWVQETTMEQALVSGVAHDTSEAKVTIIDVPDQPGVAARVFERLAERDVNVDMIVQNVSSAGQTDISFTVPRAAAALARQVAEEVALGLGAGAVDVDPGIAKVSLVGAGMKSEPGVAARMFRALAGAGINIEMISTSTIRISCIVREERIAEAVTVLADEFELGADEREAGA